MANVMNLLPARSRDIATIARTNCPLDFVQSLKSQLALRGSLSERQLETGVKAVEQWQANEYAKAQREAERAAAVSAPVAEANVIPDGMYTVVLDGIDDRVTLRLKTIHEDGHKFDGRTIISYLGGPDNDHDYVGFGFVVDGALRAWKRFGGEGSARIRAAAEVLLGAADVEKFGMAYALESGNCWHCNRTLTVPASVCRGLGPICAANLGRP